MANRFVFRQVDYRDIRVFLRDGEIRAARHPEPQACHQTSYQNLVDRRGTGMFRMPCGGVVNDYVAFYFSPYTSFAYAIHRGSVSVVDPRGVSLGASRLQDRVFIVCSVSDLSKSGLNCCFSDYALNSNAHFPNVISDLSLIEHHVHWDVFDEEPIKACIPEVGYAGVCGYFNSRATPQKYQLRKEKRMAEFLVRGAVPLSLVSCIITPDDAKKVLLQREMDASNWNIPIYTKAGCFVS